MKKVKGVKAWAVVWNYGNIEAFSSKVSAEVRVYEHLAREYKIVPCTILITPQKKPKGGK